MNTEIPKDPVILLSFVNMKLRDYYPTLEAMCEALNIDAKELSAQLAVIDYHYDADHNKFV